MKPYQPTTIEDFIIHFLSKKSHSASEMLILLAEKEHLITKQALYQIFKKLIQQEIIVKHNKQYSLSRIWIESMSHFLTNTEFFYGVEPEKVDFLNLKEGDKVSYTFKNAFDADKFWGHAFNILTETVREQGEIVLYNPHQWFLLVRKDSELQLFEKLKREGKILKNYIGHQFFLDTFIKQYFDGKSTQVITLNHPAFEASNYYINIFGERIIEVYLDEKTADEIDRFYQETTDWNEEYHQKLQNIVHQGKTKIVISHNPKRAGYLVKIIKQTI